MSRKLKPKRNFKVTIKLKTLRKMNKYQVEEIVNMGIRDLFEKGRIEAKWKNKDICLQVGYWKVLKNLTRLWVMVVVYGVMIKILKQI